MKKIKTIKQDGIELELLANVDEPIEKKALTFFEWSADTLDPSAKGAWDYKQNEVNELMRDWERSVLWGKDRLRDTIEKITKRNNQLTSEIDKLKGENLQLMKELRER